MNGDPNLVLAKTTQEKPHYYLSMKFDFKMRGKTQSMHDILCKAYDNRIMSSQMSHLHQLTAEMKIYLNLIHAVQSC